jgi:hypothetical protein
MDIITIILDTYIIIKLLYFIELCLYRLKVGVAIIYVFAKHSYNNNYCIICCCMQNLFLKKKNEFWYYNGPK